MDKPALRQHLRSLRQALDPATIQRESKKVVSKLLSHAPFMQAQRIGLYVPFDNELDIDHLKQISPDKDYYWPTITADKTLRFLSTRYPLVPSAFSVQVPDGPIDASLAVFDLDYLILPVVGFNRAGARLGFGKGHYDRTLGQKIPKQPCPLLVGVAYDFQQVPTLQADPWDIPLDIIFTPSTYYDLTHHSPLAP